MQRGGSAGPAGELGAGQGAGLYTVVSNASGQRYTTNPVPST